MSFDQVKAHLLGLYGSVRSPVTTAAMRGCEARLRVELPEDVRAAYDIMDGADHPTDPHSSWVRFWPIEEWKLAKASLPPTASLEDQDSLFILADYGIECVYYAIDLKRMSPQFGSVYALGASRVTQVAPSFFKFVELVLSDSDELHSYS